MKKRGVFISLEGGEGTGKSTQIDMLRQAFAAANIDVITTREPGGTPQAEKIRNILVQRDTGKLDPLTEVLLLFAGRREHAVNKIVPALDAGTWVITDRFADSTRAMQGAGMGVDMNLIEQIYDVTLGDLAPDLTFIFDIDPVVGLGRSTKRLQNTADQHLAAEDRYEKMELAFHQRLRQGFLDVARKNPDRCVIIDASQDIDTIHSQLVDVIEQRFAPGLKKVIRRA